MKTLLSRLLKLKMKSANEIETKIGGFNGLREDFSRYSREHGFQLRNWRNEVQLTYNSTYFAMKYIDKFENTRYFREYLGPGNRVWVKEINESEFSSLRRS